MIAVLLTPPGPGAIAVIRVTGLGASDTVRTMFRGATASGQPPTPGRLHYGQLHDTQGVIDDVILAEHVSAADGTEVVDLCVHGGVRIAERTLLALQRCGAGVGDPSDLGRAGWPWSASSRAQAEIDVALSQARTRRAVRFLARQREALPEELHRLGKLAERDEHAARQQLALLLERWQVCRSLVHGAEVAVVGPPNVGKSTLANHLVGREETLTSPIPGTTRDWTTHETAIEGVPVTVVDTAGLVCHPADRLDTVGTERGVSRAAQADVQVLVLDQTAPRPTMFADITRRVSRARLVVAVNKADLPALWRAADLEVSESIVVVSVSARTGEGMDALGRAIVGALGLEPTSEPPHPALSPKRGEECWDRLLTEAAEPPVSLVGDRQAQAASRLLAEAPGWRGRLAEGLRDVLG